MLLLKIFKNTRIVKLCKSFIDMLVSKYGFSYKTVKLLEIPVSTEMTSSSLVCESSPLLNLAKFQRNIESPITRPINNSGHATIILCGDQSGIIRAGSYIFLNMIGRRFRNSKDCIITQIIIKIYFQIFAKKFYDLRL